MGRWNDSKLHLLDELDIPVVLQNNRSRSDIFSNISGDYDTTGRLAARYFREKLYTEYASLGLGSFGEKKNFSVPLSRLWDSGTDGTPETPETKFYYNHTKVISFS